MLITTEPMNEVHLWLYTYLYKCCSKHFFLILIFFFIVWFQKLSIPPPWKGFFLWTPPPTSVELHTLLLKFWGFWEPPTPPRISNPFCGGSIMDIFWNYTFLVFFFFFNNNNNYKKGIMWTLDRRVIKMVGKL